MPDVALITGANRGFGFETARAIAGTGATTIIGARDRGSSLRPPLRATTVR